VKSAVGSCAPFSSTLGTGWKTLLEVLRRAAADTDATVVSEALGPLKVSETTIVLPVSKGPVQEALRLNGLGFDTNAGELGWVLRGYSLGFVDTSMSMNLHLQFVPDFIGDIITSCT
jgi:hypothetical protein